MLGRNIRKPQAIEVLQLWSLIFAMLRQVPPVVTASSDGRTLSAPWRGLVLGV